MTDIVLYLFGVSCQGLLFWRGWRWGGLHAYPLFYIYLSYTSFWTVALLFFLHAPWYARVYWGSEVVAAVLRFLVAWEIFRTLFGCGSVIRRIAGTVILAVLLLLALGFWLSGPSPGISLVVDFMRNMALSAGVWTVVVLGVARLYGIRIGRNTWGVAIGLLIFVASEIVNFAAFDLASWFIPIWRFIHPFAYVFMLAVWAWSLWDYAPNPQDERADSSLTPLLLREWQRQSAALDETIRKVIRP